MRVDGVGDAGDGVVGDGVGDVGDGDGVVGDDVGDVGDGFDGNAVGDGVT